jgi:hypothetical protein
MNSKHIHLHTLKIKVPKNHPGAYVGGTNIGVESEREFILPRGTNMKHLGTKTTSKPSKRYLGYTEHTHLHSMEVSKLKANK